VSVDHVHFCTENRRDCDGRGTDPGDEEKELSKWLLVSQSQKRSASSSHAEKSYII
jgi:hypothetical protein